MPKPIIQIRGISKKYHIGHQAKYITLRDEIIKGIKKPFNLIMRKNIKDSSREEFWALKDISFDVKKGEIAGIIGRNGVGKTTLLKILSRITHPTEGEIRLRGRTSSLLEVGTGFHDELTGRENIYFNGAILGMHRAEVKKKFDQIVDFSGIEKFLDVPAKRYSTGMYMRLAFAVSAHLESEILLIDEILSVGDIDFQKKCLGKIDSISKEGRTILFVTHNMAAALNLCSSGILLDGGRITYNGTISGAINYYLKETTVSHSEVHLPDSHRGFSNEIRFQAVRIYGMNGKKTSKVLLSEGFDVEIEYEVISEIQGAQIEFVLWNSKGDCIFISRDMDHASIFVDSIRMPGHYTTRCHVPGHYLRIGGYQMDISAKIPNVKILDSLPKALSLEVIYDEKMQTKITPDRQGIITPLFKWTTQKT